MSVEIDVLVIDAGNTSVKFTAFNKESVLWVRQSLSECLDCDPKAIYFASVRSEEQDVALRESIEQCFPDRRWVTLESSMEACGVMNAYEEPKRLGVDRWLSVIGAYHFVKNGLVVVDAGTAIKFDAVNLNGRHLGGYIAPGLGMMEKALLANTARIRYDVTEVVQGEGLPNSTARAVSEGCLEMALGFLERLYAQYADHTWLITGGDAKTLMGLLDIPWTHQENLVALGAKLVGDEQIRGNK